VDSASGSGFNPLAAEKRENEFRPRDGADQRRLFFGSRTRKPRSSEQKLYYRREI